METLNYVEILAAIVGLVLSVVVCVFPRFGPVSWMLALILMPASALSAILGLAPILNWPPEDVVFRSFACLILCTIGGFLASYGMERADHSNLKKNRWFFICISVAAPLLTTALYLFRPDLEISDSNLVALGPAGYAGAAYLLLVAIVIIANVEQLLRSASEYVRWEIKFLLLGVASLFATVIYIATQILLYPPEFSYLPFYSLKVFPIIFLCASLLTLQSWRRSTGRGRVAVSQSFVHSTITLFSVGGYLVATSQIAHWFSAWAPSEVALEPIIFLVSAIVLSAILLGTTMRHRLRRWIRRNLFAGNYDYRQLWMDATERVRSIDSPGATATALSQIIHDALGSLEISVWLRARDIAKMQLVYARGNISELLEQKASLLIEPPDLKEPVAISELQQQALWPPQFLKQAEGSLVVPLISSGRLVGLLTVGPDRSGRGLDREAREFLRVLAGHAASEFHKSELQQSLVQTREAEAFQTFSTFLLHDLKNFASTLSLIAKNASRHHGNPDFQLDAFGSILDTAEKMKRLCNGLRTFSTSLAANKKLEDLNDIVIVAVRDFESSLSKRLKLDLSPVPEIEVDRQDFSRVLQNLILNANEAGPTEPIELKTRSEPRGIVISVIDKGQGIPQDFLENGLFQPFHTTKRDGLGIGLFQCKKIVEAHDGTIEVESKEGAGTLVRIILPVRPTLISTQALSLDPAAADLSKAPPLRQAAAKS